MVETASLKKNVFPMVFDHFSKTYYIPLVFLIFCPKMMNNLVFFDMCLAKCTTVQAKTRVKITKYRFFQYKMNKNETIRGSPGFPGNGTWPAARNHPDSRQRLG